MAKISTARATNMPAFAMILLLALLLASGEEAVRLTPREHLAAQISWIESHGGYFSSKIEVRSHDPEDATSSVGMFVSAPVDVDEVLMVIPKECILGSGQTRHWCDSVTSLAEEHERGQESEYYPYVSYCFDPRHDGDLPATWSEGGKALLRKIAGNAAFDGVDGGKEAADEGADDDYGNYDDSEDEKGQGVTKPKPVGSELFPKFDVAGQTYHAECGSRAPSHPTALEDRAFHSVLRRSWDDKMLPVFDMINHRNGAYKNVDSNSPHDNDDVRVVAVRDIRKGEQLYLSYNECTDCAYSRDYAHGYVMPKLLRDYGFVEQYPARWEFFDRKVGGAIRVQLEEVAPDVILDDKSGGDGAGRLRLRWLNENGVLSPEDVDEIKLWQRLHAHLDRVKRINVREMAVGLPPHEANTSIRFHEALVTVLQHMLWHVEDLPEAPEDGGPFVGGTSSAPVVYGVGSRPMESLGGPRDPIDWDRGDGYHVEFNDHTCSWAYLNSVRFDDKADYTDIELEESPRYALLDVAETHWQKMTFWQSREYDAGERDVIFKIDRSWESCQSNRAHYHEVIVHHPASYVPDVRRVLFLGGGDSMLLHEVLKYPNLELVVGLELDKGVNQASYLLFETLPHFDDDRVEWWFGDASLSLRILPGAYLGSFDLIVVDLQTAVINALGIMESVMRYAHPDHGVVVRNEDSGWGTNMPFAMHQVDLHDNDVPVYCHQLVTMGSDIVDFAAAPRYVHELAGANLYYDPAAEAAEEARFRRWANYRREGKFAERDKTPGAPASAGILMALELEGADAERFSTQVLEAALGDGGLVVEQTFVHDNERILVFRQGYVIARFFPDERYCGCDVVFWTDLEKAYSLERALRVSLGSETASSYRIVTAGVREVADPVETNGTPKEKGGGEPPSCETEGVGCKGMEPGGPSLADATLQNAVDLLLPKGPLSEVLVLCGEDSQPCTASDLAGSQLNVRHLSTFHACPESQSIFACESEFRSLVHGARTRGRKIDAVLIDATAPKRTGQIVSKVFGRAELRGRVLSDDLVALAVTTGLASSAWAGILLDQFRTNFFPYSPSFHAEVEYHRGDRDRQSGDGASPGCYLSVYSAGNVNFYADLSRAVGEIGEATGLRSEVQSVRDGLNNYVTDFSPSQEFSRGDYEMSEPQRRRAAQTIMGRQSVLRFEEAAVPPTENTASFVTSKLDAVLVAISEGGSGWKLHHAEVGDGIVAFALWHGGDASLVFDGESLMDLTVFTLDQDQELHEDFEAYFLEVMHSASLKLRDSQPRGTGRVVAFGESPWDD